MLSHFYQPDLSPEVEDAMLVDWIDALRDIPQQATEDAIRAWLRGEIKRPTPAHIRKLAQRRMEAPKPPPVPDDEEWPFCPKVIPPAELERRRELAERICADIARKKRVPKGGEAE